MSNAPSSSALFLQRLGLSRDARDCQIQLVTTSGTRSDGNFVVWQQPPEVVAIIMTQLSLKAGLKAWKEKGYEGAFPEMKQLHMRDTFRPS